MADDEGKKVLKPGDEGYIDPKSEGYGDGESTELSTEEIKTMLEENAALRSSNSRLEGESKDNKKKYQAKVAAEEQAKRAKLLADGKTEELLEEERKDKQRISDELVATKSRTIRTKLENEILKLAPNCHDVNDVISNLSTEKYSIDSSTETVSGVKEALADVQKRKPYLFSLKKMPDSYNGGAAGEGDSSSKGKGKVLTYDEYLALPTKKAMEEALSEGRVEGL